MPKRPMIAPPPAQMQKDSSPNTVATQFFPWQERSMRATKHPSFKDQPFYWDSAVRGYKLHLVYHPEYTAKQQSDARISRVRLMRKKTNIKLETTKSGYYLSPVNYFAWIANFTPNVALPAEIINGFIALAHTDGYGFTSTDIQELRTIALRIYREFIIPNPILKSNLASHILLDEFNRYLIISSEVNKVLHNLQHSSLPTEVTTEVTNTTTSFLQSHQQSLNLIAANILLIDEVNTNRWATPAAEMQQIVPTYEEELNFEEDGLTIEVANANSSSLKFATNPEDHSVQVNDNFTWLESMLMAEAAPPQKVTSSFPTNAAISIEDVSLNPAQAEFDDLLSLLGEEKPIHSPTKLNRF